MGWHIENSRKDKNQYEMPIWHHKNRYNEVKDYIEDILRDQNDINEEHGAQLEAISMALSELQTQKRQQKPMQPIGFNAPQYHENQ